MPALDDSHDGNRREGKAAVPRTAPRNRLRQTSAMEALAAMLERSDAYRVLRRLDVLLTPLPQRLDGRLALFVDVETTGLEPSSDQIIQLAAVPFQYDREGRILAVHEPLDQLRDPGMRIPEEVTELTGIDDDAVRGRAIDVAALGDLVSRAAIVVAHNARFDRAFLENLIPDFAQMPWACSMSDVPWREEGVTALKLELLAAAAGFFFEAHRAADDCLAAVELLRRPLPRSGRIAMTELLRNARRDTMRVTAPGAPFGLKHLLKRRRYRWCPTSAGDGAMAWTIEVPAERLDGEIRFLRDEIYGRDVDPPVSRVSAYDRYSGR